MRDNEKEKASRKPIVFGAVMLVLVVLILIWNNSLNSGSISTAPLEGAEQFSFLLNMTDSTEYYLTYSENPVLQYITHTQTFTGSDGEQHPIAFDFQTMPLGSQTDTINTLLSTQSYPDVMGTTFIGTSIYELYENGVALDLTDYVHQYMPNYLRFLEENPDLMRDATYIIDGETKFLTLNGYKKQLDIYQDMFSGFCYRRDWLVKYAVNPLTGEVFSGYYSLDQNGNTIHEEQWTENVDGDSWVDDVIFPSGTGNPIYISDWEWMFEAFSRALVEEQIEDGYCLSVYYPGYNANGDLETGFGGTGVLWYMDENGKVQFGADGDGMKAYLECLHSWYEKGWLDQRFMERSGDMFYRIDETSFRQGKVGLWLGSSSTLGSRLHSDVLPACQSIVVYGAAQPINDVYGDTSVQGKNPISYYYPLRTGEGYIVTNKATEKDIAIFCSFIDYLYSEEGAYLYNYGLSAEQQAAWPTPMYEKYGYFYGAYTTETDDTGHTVVHYADGLIEDKDLRTAMTLNRMFGLGNAAEVDYGYGPAYVNSFQQWAKYDAYGFASIIGIRLTSEQASNQAKIRVRIEQEYMYLEVPKFITGQLSLDSDWENYCSDLVKRRYKNVTEYYQTQYDMQ